VEWSTIRRETSLIEHQCEHGIGHPNAYSAYRLHIKDIYADGNMPTTDDVLNAAHESYWSTHGCDGCCAREDFPGHFKTDDEVVERLQDVLEAFMQGTQYEGEFLSAARVRNWLAFTHHDMTVNDEIAWAVDAVV
jgi:hypothetical protein